ncbi:MAG: 30S ribosomal protein S12 methylthiotransferase RimO [Lachnospiraceae bacterium]|jgi:ribosomal protein S12 methylthiotransferase|nr:30S ribosomal protein S12 methylthiotransferase RimO [Lachnospiraceae bacterium]
MKLACVSLGCDKNLVDSERLLGTLGGEGFTFDDVQGDTGGCVGDGPRRRAGFTLTDDLGEADVILVNTCCFIGRAKEESINALLDAAGWKERGKCRALVAAGCLAQRYHAEILEDIPEVDAIVGPHAYGKVSGAIRRALAGEKVVEVAMPGGSGHIDEHGAGVNGTDRHSTGGHGTDVHSGDGHSSDGHGTGGYSTDVYGGDGHGSDGHSTGGNGTDGKVAVGPIGGVPGGCAPGKVQVPKRILSTGGHYAYLKIAEGCDKHCTYCVIPSLRGHYRSAPLEELVEEARTLAAGGVKELILVAQETTVYGLDLYGDKRLPALLRALAAVDGIYWIRLLYCYPEEITDELLDVMAGEPKICHYLDIPIQHASDKILKLMGRRTDSESLRRVIRKAREAVPDICLRTTLISGFPSETEEDHQASMGFVREMRFDRLGVFAYSREEGTPAAMMPGQVPERLKQKRRRELMRLQQGISKEISRGMVGRKLQVFAEGEMDDGRWVGRTYRDAPEVDGRIVFRVAKDASATGTLLTSPPHADGEGGDFVWVRVTGAGAYDLKGEVWDEPTK